jgi:hypothetical protein
MAVTMRRPAWQMCSASRSLAAKYMRGGLYHARRSRKFRLRPGGNSTESPLGGTFVVNSEPNGGLASDWPAHITLTCSAVVSRWRQVYIQVLCVFEVAASNKRTIFEHRTHKVRYTKRCPKGKSGTTARSHRLGSPIWGSPAVSAWKEPGEGF